MNLERSDDQGSKGPKPGLYPSGQLIPHLVFQHRHSTDTDTCSDIDFQGGRATDLVLSRTGFNIEGQAFVVNLIQNGDVVDSLPALLLVPGERKQFKHRPGLRSCFAKTFRHFTNY